MLAALVGLLLSQATPAHARQLDPENCMLCHGLPWLAVENDTTGVHNFQVREDHYADSVHGALSCRECHTDIDRVPHATPVQPVDCGTACHVVDPYTGDTFSHRDVTLKLAESVHGQKSGEPSDADKPVCKDCHHNTSYSRDIPQLFLDAESKCTACHDDFKGLDRTLDHMALHLGEDEFWKTRQNYNACVRCHSDDDLRTDSLGVPVHETIVGGFLKSFHGRGFRLGDSRSPVCNDCHGNHSIFAENDLRSMVHYNNRQKTCSTIGCHDGASVEFSTTGSMHDLYEGWQAYGLKIVLWFYVILIIGLLGVMALHNLLDTIARWREVRRNPEKHAKVHGAASRRIYFRMSKGERISHVLMFVSFTLLAITGAILWLPESYFAIGEDHTSLLVARAWAHRAAAILITVIGVYHIYVAIFTKRGRSLIMQMIPKPSDAVLAWQNLLWMLRLRKERPLFGYFGYAEKLEYWGFAWGSVVMTATGVILWFEHLGNKYIVDISRLVHSLEAILAVGTIVIWHFWNVNWKPGRFPMAEDWITGAIDRHEMEDEHAGLLNEIEDHNKTTFLPREQLVGEADPKDRWFVSGSSRRSFMKSTGLVILLLTSMTCVFMGWAFTEYVKTLDPNYKQFQEEKSLVDLGIPDGDPSYQAAAIHLDDDYRYGRFHSTIPVIQIDPNLRRSECLACHSMLPHGESLRKRAALNMHSRFMTCVTCHHEKSSEANPEFVWADLRISKDGEPGEPYGIHESPSKGDLNFTSYITLSTAEGALFNDQQSEDVRRLLAERESLDDEELKKRADDTFHKALIPMEQMTLECTDCHKQDGRMDFRRLGFDEERVKHLQSESLAATVTDYDEFYLPPSH